MSHLPVTLTIVLAVLLSVVGSIRGEIREIFFPIVTHAESDQGPAYRSNLFLLNSSEYSVKGDLLEASPGTGRSHKDLTIAPNSMSGSLPNWDFGGLGEWRSGWARFRYRFVDVPDADKERVSKLRLLAWTELKLFKRGGWSGDPTNPVVGVANLPAVEAALEFRVPGILRREPEKPAEAAIAILNPSEEPIQIEVTLFHYNPKEHNEKDVQITNMLSVPPMDRLSRFLWELMTEGREDPPARPLHSYRSTLRIRGSAPIAVGALLYYRNGTFGNLPVVRVDQK